MGVKFNKKERYLLKILFEDAEYLDVTQTGLKDSDLVKMHKKLVTWVKIK